MNRAAAAPPARAIRPFLLIAALACPRAAHAQSATPAEVIVRTGAAPLNELRPDLALGGGVDGHAEGWTRRVLRPDVVAAMRSIGLRSLTYRLRTELGIEVWHWNPRGEWSDPVRRQGYWRSSAMPVKDSLIEVSWGYRLPRRGNTVDQANDEGYSRLDDGSDSTFWKSNPYLDPRVTGAHPPSHAQWVLVEFPRRVPVDAIRIRWADPFAVDFDVQRWVGATQPEDVDDVPPGAWQAFPHGTVRGARGRTTFLRLADRPVPVRWVRIFLRRASGTALPGSRDWRDSLGYAIRELSVGRVDPRGVFRDEVRHGAARNRQTVVWTSSTDPWHREIDRDPETEQPGLDRIADSGLTNGLPLLVPVGVLYDTPENAAAELEYLGRRGVPVRGVELGEEPDGQRVRPEDYAALYLHWAERLRAVAPNASLGGPSLQTLYYGEMAPWHDTPERLGWMGRFVRYLRQRGALGTWQFFSYEWYPVDSVCARTAPYVRSMAADFRAGLEDLRKDGVPSSVPMYMTELGYSAFAGQPEVDLAGAVLDADAVGTFFSAGGRALYAYGYEPGSLDPGPGCPSWGDNMMFGMDENARIAYRTAVGRVMELIAKEWVEPGMGIHWLFPAAVRGHGGAEDDALGAYPLLRPDGRWSVLLVNRAADSARAVKLTFLAGDGSASALAGTSDVFLFGPDQYAWLADGPRGHPTRSDPPAHRTLAPGETVLLPPYSVAVLRGTGPRPPGFAGGQPATR